MPNQEPLARHKPIAPLPHWRQRPKASRKRSKAKRIVEEDFYLLVEFIEVNGFTQLVSTPHSLTEASNLIGLERYLLRTLGRDAIK